MCSMNAFSPEQSTMQHAHRRYAASPPTAPAALNAGLPAGLPHRPPPAPAPPPAPPATPEYAARTAALSAWAAGTWRAAGALGCGCQPVCGARVGRRCAGVGEAARRAGEGERLRFCPRSCELPLELERCRFFFSCLCSFFCHRTGFVRGCRCVSEVPHAGQRRARRANHA